MPSTRPPRKLQVRVPPSDIGRGTIFELSPRVFTYNKGVYLTIYQNLHKEYVEFYGYEGDFLEEKQLFIAFRPDMGWFGYSRTPLSYGVDLRYVKFFGMQFGYVHSVINDTPQFFDPVDDGAFSLEHEEII